MLHSGSRSLGKAICDEYQRRALALDRADAVSSCPHRELAYLPTDTDDHARLLGGDEVRPPVRGGQPERGCSTSSSGPSPRDTRIGRFERVVDIHHNYAAWEDHFGRRRDRPPQGRRARSRAGETVLIPGSMGTASYVGEGLGNPEAFETCQHGAGRAMSRTRGPREAKTSRRGLRRDGRASASPSTPAEPRAVAEEAAFAYKDIESVMAASASLVRPTKRLTPLGVVKG